MISLKTFYLLYAPLILLVFLDKSFRGKFINLLIQKSSIFSIIFLSIAIFFNFLNTGCLVYPAVFTCFDSLYWSFPEKIVLEINQWYEIWSKAGATPDFFKTGEYVNNPQKYISGLNWVSNWTEVYFFNKVSDYLLGLIFFTTIFYFTFLHTFKRINIFSLDKKIYFISFYNRMVSKDPALDMEDIICLPFYFLFQSVSISKNMSYKEFTKRSSILLLVTL